MSSRKCNECTATAYQFFFFCLNYGNKRPRTEDTTTNSSNNKMKWKKYTPKWNGSAHKKGRWDNKCIMKTEHTNNHTSHARLYARKKRSLLSQTVIKCVYSVQKLMHHHDQRAITVIKQASTSRLSFRHLPLLDGVVWCEIFGVHVFSRLNAIFWGDAILDEELVNLWVDKELTNLRLLKKAFSTVSLDVSSTH